MVQTLDKCVNLQCCQSLNSLPTNYFIESHILKSVNQPPYLGVMLDKIMSFSRILTTLSNLSNCLQSTKESAYLSLVRPALEYASTVWDPYQPVYSPNIEKIQRRAAHWVLNIQ